MENTCSEVLMKRAKNTLLHSPVAKKLKNPNLKYLFIIISLYGIMVICHGFMIETQVQGNNVQGSKVQGISLCLYSETKLPVFSHFFS